MVTSLMSPSAKVVTVAPSMSKLTVATEWSDELEPEAVDDVLELLAGFQGKPLPDVEGGTPQSSLEPLLDCRLVPKNFRQRRSRPT